MATLRLHRTTFTERAMMRAFHSEWVLSRAAAIRSHCQTTNLPSDGQTDHRHQSRASFATTSESPLVQTCKTATRVSSITRKFRHHDAITSRSVTRRPRRRLKSLSKRRTSGTKAPMPRTSSSSKDSRMSTPRSITRGEQPPSILYTIVANDNHQQKHKLI